ncbi:hypothetical protein BSPWISOXPB_3816 [uncultured Gammaproteobacteria bacterium]|nr:hypothetical protein BSPWISOXPB_3816 [uncultured Gammaproteobacteria bacterium]
MHENGAKYKQVETGKNPCITNKTSFKKYKDRYGKYPPLNKNGK